jgi:hypothetical protein
MHLYRAVLAPALLLGATVVTGAARADQAHPYQPGPALTEEASSQDLCESVPNRVFVATKLGSECVAYTVSKGYEDRREAVFLINGDSQGFADAALLDGWKPLLAPQKQETAKAPRKKKAS